MCVPVRVQWLGINYLHISSSADTLYPVLCTLSDSAAILFRKIFHGDKFKLKVSEYLENICGNICCGWCVVYKLFWQSRVWLLNEFPELLRSRSRNIIPLLRSAQHIVLEIGNKNPHQQNINKFGVASTNTTIIYQALTRFMFPHQFLIFHRHVAPTQTFCTTSTWLDWKSLWYI